MKEISSGVGGKSAQVSQELSLKAPREPVEVKELVDEDNRVSS